MHLRMEAMLIALAPEPVSRGIKTTWNKQDT